MLRRHQAEVQSLTARSPGRRLVVPIHQTWGTGEEARLTTGLLLKSAGLVVHHQDYGKP
jgi:hypothetical protein